MTQADSRQRAEVDLDHHSPEFREDPHGTFRRMRESGCPVAHSPHYGGFWALVDYASVFEASRDDELFNSAPSIGVPASPIPFPILPIESDPPATLELREATLRRFSPASAERFRESALEMTDEAIDAFIERGECDLVGELTTPLPARLILRLLNFDESRAMEWVRWVHSTVHDRAHNPEKAAEAGMAMFAEIGKHMEQRRSQGLGDDLFSDILRGTLNGKPLDDTQITMYAFLMMLGGMDTTSGFTGNVLLRLCQDPQLRQQLIADPELIKKGTDELLRLYSPTLGLARTVSRDAEFHGQPLCAGDRAILMWGAANRDPAMFDDPDTLDLARPNAKKHMAFGVGIHRCLGSHYAKMMFQVMVGQVLKRLPDFELAGEPERFADAGEVYAVRKLPVRFTPGPRKG
ncbi:cytochrome P450 [Mycobacterium heckeshornense]|uniref:Cytochrome P450 n=1 Tax=Mycobacterium heckeshornense TaxID=110505 RepID=A0A2G8B4T0_9MYCO|nr:cytochrome P450 [Mycobacterium heckeshornense]KMV24190.1 cytochrome P450 [Mycobacterium heckeshornense]MCV7036415.1 cytochrome P450 [Mycobacterium heckeshornense]PIJ32752.1 cytochrome P450 [Mycobacterium heckeshornense]BCO34275.1 cytochrome P450 [Mycobacterium heckeshornense]BCQ07356.1 cytochrome P450 [Mycobacterium heckeshornense]